MKRFNKIVIGTLVALFTVTSIPTAPVSAISSASLSIVPKKNYVIEPGKSIKDTLVIRNLDAKEKLELTLRVVDFTFTDDGGTPKLLLAENAPQTTWSLKPFLTVPKTVTVDPNKSKTVDLGVSIPAKQGAGSFYSAVIYSSGDSEGGNVGLSASGVTLVFTSIPGSVNESLKLEKFGAYKEAAVGQPGSYMTLMMDQPEVLAYTLKNNGNVTESPVGSIKLKHMFGKEQTIGDLNPNSSLALIGQTRTFTTCIKLKAQDLNFNGAQTRTRECTSPGLWPGMYTATLDMFYGQNGNKTQEITKTITFWYLPLWSLIVLLVIILVIAYFVWRIKRMLNRSRSSKTMKSFGRKR